MNADQGIERELALAPRRRQGPGRVIVSIAEILEDDGFRITAALIQGGDAAHERRGTQKGCDSAVEMGLTATSVACCCRYEWRLDDQAARHVVWHVRGVCGREEGERGNQGFDFLFDADVGDGARAKTVGAPEPVRQRRSRKRRVVQTRPERGKGVSARRDSRYVAASGRMNCVKERRPGPRKSRSQSRSVAARNKLILSSPMIAKSSRCSSKYLAGTSR